MQEYKSLCAVVTIYAIIVNIQTDRHTDSIWPAYIDQNRSASWAKI